MNPVSWRTRVVAIAVRILAPPISGMEYHFSPDALAELTSAGESFRFCIKRQTGLFRMVLLDGPLAAMGQSMNFCSGHSNSSPIQKPKPRCIQNH